MRIALAEASRSRDAYPGETGAALSAAVRASVGRHVLQLRLELVAQRHGARHLASTYIECYAPSGLSGMGMHISARSRQDSLGVGPTGTHCESRRSKKLAASPAAGHTWAIR